MSFFKRVLNLGKGMVSTLGSDREDRLRAEALEAELAKPARVAKGAGKGGSLREEEESAPATSGPHPASDPLARPPVKRTL